MGVEVVYHEVPTLCLWVRADDRLDVCQKVFLFTGGGAVGCDELAAEYVAAQDERAGAVANILEFAPYYLASYQGQVGVFRLQRLYPGEFIRTQDSFPRRRKRLGLPIETTDVGYLGVELLVIAPCQPVADKVRLESPLFINREA